MKRQPATPLARGYRRQRREPLAAAANRGCCGLVIPQDEAPALTRLYGIL
jgi:hypothetical protein